MRIPTELRGATAAVALFLALVATLALGWYLGGDLGVKINVLRAGQAPDEYGEYVEACGSRLTCSMFVAEHPALDRYLSRRSDLRQQGQAAGEWLGFGVVAAAWVGAGIGRLGRR
jgi:hypothetical protein